MPDNHCINCLYCMLHDSTCAHPEHDYCTIDYNDPACPLFEPEQTNQ